MDVTSMSKNELILHLRISRHSEVINFIYHCQNYHKTESGTRCSDKFEIEILKISRRGSRSSHNAEFRQKTAKKCTKNYNVRAKPLFFSLNLLFRDVPVAVAVVVFLNSFVFCERSKPKTRTKTYNKELCRVS